MAMLYICVSDTGRSGGGDSQLPNINEMDMTIQTDPRIMRMTVGEVSV